jgi:hypothetical protein
VRARQSEVALDDPFLLFVADGGRHHSANKTDGGLFAGPARALLDWLAF